VHDWISAMINSIRDEDPRTQSHSTSVCSELMGGALTTFDNTSFSHQPLSISSNTALLLINPDSGGQSNIAKFVVSPYHGTWRLKHFLQNRHGFTTEVADLAIHDRAELLRLVSLHQPPVIGCAFFYDTLARDLENIWSIRQASPSSFLVVGGIEATARSNEYIEKLPIDGLCLGEGEYPLLSLLRQIPRGNVKPSKDEIISSCTNVPGWLFKTSTADIVTTGPAQVMEPDQYHEVFQSYSLHSGMYKPYWSFIKKYPSYVLNVLDIHPKVIRLITSNYCPHGCKFCIGTLFLKLASGQKKVPVIMASAEAIIDRVDQILNHDPDVFIFFDDDNFLVNRQRVRRVCKFILEKGIRGSFGCRAIVSQVHQDICLLMKNAGFKLVSIGVESWDPACLADYNKQIVVQDLHRAISTIQTSGMKCSINIILFGPKSTKDGLIETCDCILKYISEDVNVGITSYIVPYPGTHYFQNPTYFSLPGTLIVPGTHAVLDYPQAVLPSDEAIRRLAANALTRGKDTISQWKAELQWHFSIVPREVADLALISAVYHELDLLDRNDRDIKIRRIVEYILTNQRSPVIRSGI